MKKTNLLLILLAILLLAACNNNPPAPSNPELEKVPEGLYGHYTFPNDIVVDVDEGKILIDGSNVATPDGVVSYVNGYLATSNSGLQGLTIKKETVRYASTATSVEIAFGGLESDEGTAPGTGSISLSKDSDGFHLLFEAETILNDYRVNDNFGFDDAGEGPSDPAEPSASKFDTVQEALFGTYTDDTTIVISEGSILVDGNNVTTATGVASYVNPILKEKLGDNLSINEETVDYFYYADSAIITFGGIPSDTDFDPGTGSMTFKKSADGFHYSFEVDTVIEDMIATYTFSVSYPV